MHADKVLKTDTRKEVETKQSHTHSRETMKGTVFALLVIQYMMRDDALIAFHRIYKAFSHVHSSSRDLNLIVCNLQ